MEQRSYLSGTVLYVDDDMANLTVLQAACTDEFDVLTAPSGAEALEIMAEREIAVLLVDQRMPGMTGVELLETARQRHPQVLRILITAYSDLADAIAAINRGQVRSYIRKPWEPEQLKAVLRDALEVYDTRRKVRDLEQRLLETERVYALGIIVAGVAHELRNPLTALMANLDLAAMQVRHLLDALGRDPGADPSHAESVRSVADLIGEGTLTANRLAETVRGIQLSHRRQDDQSSADLREVTDLTLRCVRSDLLKRAHVTVDMESVPPVAGSPNKLGQVVLNLLINALQALPDRPRNENSVVVRLRGDGDRVTLEVRDNGSGIAPNVLHRVFDPFFTTKASGGTGLGLAITKKIVDEVGGTIAVESTLMEGTRFTLSLPVAVDD